jgi:two-component system, CitB family, sensor kinase
MTRIVSLRSPGWSLARQLITLQLCVVVTAVGIEAMVAIYRGPPTAASWEQRQVLGLVTLTEVALLVGISGSLFLADRVRRQTFDMEPAEIARRYQHHDAMLHAVREGLIITDVDGGIVLANDEARRLLKLSDDCEGKALRDEVPWVAAQEPVTDLLEYVPGRVLMISRSQAEVDGVPAGLVTTLRDRTELQQTLNELSLVRELSDELRKQAHEHANHLQKIIALIHRRQYSAAIDACAKFSEMPQELSDQMLARVADLGLATRLQQSHAYAERRGVELRLDGTLRTASPDLGDRLAVIAGNLSDNAIDAASQRQPGGLVQVSLGPGAHGCLHVTVRDNGGGITTEPVEDVFAPGHSTKGSGRGYGLARVRDEVSVLRGTITARNEGEGAVFDVCIPLPSPQERP